MKSGFENPTLERIETAEGTSLSVRQFFRKGQEHSTILALSPRAGTGICKWRKWKEACRQSPLLFYRWGAYFNWFEFTSSGVYQSAK